MFELNIFLRNFGNLKITKTYICEKKNYYDWKIIVKKIKFTIDFCKSF